MSATYTGGCACGDVRFEIGGEPVAMVDCQCRDCQRRSGTGHGSYLTFATRKTATFTGDARFWEVAGDAGTIKRHAFCPICGAPVYLLFPGAPELVAIHAAALDDTSPYRPQFVTYARSAPAWDAVDPSLVTFEGMPPSAG
jgi:hypothetical protein